MTYLTNDLIEHERAAKAAILALSMVFCLVGCAKKPRKATCSSIEMNELSDIPPREERKALLTHLLLSRCKGWPAYMKNILAPDPSVLWAKPIKAEEIWRDFAPLCSNVRLPRTHPRDLESHQYRALFKKCRLSELDLVTERELLRERGWAVLALNLYGMLTRGGMPKSKARKLSRIFLDRYLSFSRDPDNKIRFPFGGSSAEPASGPQVSVSQEMLFCNHKRLIPLVNGRIEREPARSAGASGIGEPHIKTLLDCLAQDLHRRRKAKKVLGYVIDQTLSLVADGRIPFETITRIVRTAEKVGYLYVQVITDHPNGAFGSILLQTRANKAERETAGEIGLVVTVFRKGYDLKSNLGNECPKKDLPAGRHCFVKKKKKTEVALSSLAMHLFHLFSTRYKEPKWWKHDPLKRASLTLTAEPAVTLQEVVSVLDAVRSFPPLEMTHSTGAKRPKECRFIFERKTLTWHLFDPDVCMYNRISLDGPSSR